MEHSNNNDGNSSRTIDGGVIRLSKCVKVLSMSRIIRQSAIALFLCLVVIILGWRTTTPTLTVQAQSQITPHSTASNAFLELSVELTIAIRGTLVTLIIIYHHIGFPYTSISINPAENITFDPLLSMPCKYDEHPNGCKEITFRTLSNGLVQFNAGTTGEVYNESCHCFVWGTAQDNGPASLIIADTIW